MSDITRDGCITGLRQLADLLEQQPAVPLPYDGTDSRIAFFLHGDDAADQVIAAATALQITQFDIDKVEADNAPDYWWICGTSTRLGLNIGLLWQVGTNPERRRASLHAALAPLAVPA